MLLQAILQLPDTVVVVKEESKEKTDINMTQRGLMKMVLLTQQQLSQAILNREKKEPTASPVA